MWDRQGGLCAACRDKPPTQVDHDHSCCSGKTSCGKCVRGLLCSKCNLIAGLLELNHDKFPKVREYLKEYGPLAQW